jgi:hypothetical protein
MILTFVSLETTTQKTYIQICMSIPGEPTIQYNITNDKGQRMICIEYYDVGTLAEM